MKRHTRKDIVWLIVFIVIQTTCILLKLADVWYFGKTPWVAIFIWTIALFIVWTINAIGDIVIFTCNKNEKPKF